MSDGMERDKAEMLTAKEREEQEEMKRELLDMKMYETWYTYNEMKQILGFINESKDMANMANDEKNAQKEISQSSNDSVSEAMPKTNLAQELEKPQEHNNTTRSLHLHRSRHSSPILDRISTHSCGSPEPTPATLDSRNSAYRNKNLDSDDTVDRLPDNLDIRDSYSHNTNRYMSLKSKNTLQDSHSMHSTETKMDTHPERDQKLERWQINPLDSCVGENDAPLQQPDRPLVQDRMPFSRLCKEAKTSEMLEKLLHTLNIHLKETAEMWYSWHRTTDTKFQWGSPIQVGLAKGSWDKKSELTCVKTEENQMECTNKFNNERSNKRKSAMALSYSDTRHSSSDEDERIFKKTKTQSYEGSSTRILRSQKEEVVTRDEKDQCLHDENISKDVDRMETKNLEVAPERKECFSPEISLYSIKIPSPNPGKNINKKHNINTPAKSSSIHDSNNEEQQSAIIGLLLPKGRGTSGALTDQEILIEVEDDSTSGSDNINKGKSESTEIKPLPVKGLSRRIKNECMILERIQMDKRKKMETEKEETQRKENEEKRKREEFYKKQTEERQERDKQWEEGQKSREEKSKKWNDIMDTKLRKKINEEGREKLQHSRLREQNENTILEDTEEDRLLQDNSGFVTKRMKILRNDLRNSVNCPICNQPFPSEQIEEHAAGCEQYITDDEDENNANFFGDKTTPINANNDGAFECGVCCVYRTTNGNHYQEHVNECLRKQRQEESPDECATTEIDNILNSPIRCYRPISEQTDSDIDYRSQFPSNSRAWKHSSKRRKRKD